MSLLTILLSLQPNEVNLLLDHVSRSGFREAKCLVKIEIDHAGQPLGAEFESWAEDPKNERDQKIEYFKGRRLGGPSLELFKIGRPAGSWVFHRPKDSDAWRKEEWGPFGKQMRAGPERPPVTAFIRVRPPIDSFLSTSRSVAKSFKLEKSNGRDDTSFRFACGRCPLLWKALRFGTWQRRTEDHRKPRDVDPGRFEPSDAVRVERKPLEQIVGRKDDDPNDPRLQGLREEGFGGPARKNERVAGRSPPPGTRESLL